MLVDSYVYRSFLKTVLLVVVLGAFHGLVILPVLLTLLFCQHEEDNDGDTITQTSGTHSARASPPGHLTPPYHHRGHHHPITTTNAQHAHGAAAAAAAMHTQHFYGAHQQTPDYPSQFDVSRMHTTRQLHMSADDLPYMITAGGIFR